MRERERASEPSGGLEVSASASERASRYVCYRCGEIILLLRRMGLEFFSPFFRICLVELSRSGWKRKIIVDPFPDPGRNKDSNYRG